MLLGYNTNGFANHDLGAALEILAEIGFRSVAITLDHAALNPYGDDVEREVKRVRGRLETLGLKSVIETGARFLLDPRRKHEPTLVSADPAGRAARIDFLCRAIDIAVELGSDCVSLWSGTLHDGAGPPEALDRLVAGLRQVLDYAEQRQVPLGLEPEPGMVIDTMAAFEQLLERVDAPQLQLTLDVGHLHCQGELPIAAAVRRWGSRLVNVHIEDMRTGVHEHLMFGEGEMEFPPIIEAFRAVGYAGGLHVELSRHSHEAPAAARRAFSFLESVLSAQD